MKKTLLGSFLLLTIILTGCIDPWKDRDYTFTEGFAELNKTGQKYGASFHDEQLGKRVVALENIDPYMEELKALRENIKKTKDTADRAALLDFINVRILMLLAEKHYQLARNIGDIGLVTDAEGFSCSETPYILEAANEYNQSYIHAIKTTGGLDIILFQHKEVKKLQDLIGINQNKTWFYYSPLHNITTTAKTNVETIKKFCRAKVVKK